MLTILDTLSLAGDRAKQNDDVAGAYGALAWVIDGATDLHTPSLTGWPTDAAWIAQTAHGLLHQAALAGVDGDLTTLIADASTAAAARYARLVTRQPDNTSPERWMRPIASLLLIRESKDGLSGADLGDCRVFVLDKTGAARSHGGPPKAADNETALAAQAAKNAGGGAALMRHEDTLQMLRDMRALQNRPGANWTFGIDPECAANARTWDVKLERPAYILLASDGLAALADRYDAFDEDSLVREALAQGLAPLSERLRAIENADHGGEAHPRWKKSDDATALLLRLD